MLAPGPWHTSPSSRRTKPCQNGIAVVRALKSCPIASHSRKAVSTAEFAENAEEETFFSAVSAPSAVKRKQHNDHGRPGARGRVKTQCHAEPQARNLGRSCAEIPRCARDDTLRRGDGTF